MPVVREELGPSLPQLLAPHWRRLSRGGRVAAVAACVAVVLALVALRLALRDEPLKVLVVRTPPAFNLAHKKQLLQVPPQPGELVRLQSEPGPHSGESFTVKPLHLAPYRGDVSSAFLPLASTRLAQLRAADPGVTYRGEGKARINLVPGYQLAWQTRARGHTVYGKIVFLMPLPTAKVPQPRDGVELTLLSVRSGATPNLDAVGNTNLLKAPLRSFRFGTERP